MSAGRVIVPLRGGSDGDATHRPKDPAWARVSPPTIYLEKLAIKWMKERGEFHQGISYILERLPAGYALYQKARQAGPAHIDKHLYGHPSQRYFDSPNRFYPHFKHLVDNGGSNIGCECTVCTSPGKPAPIGAASTFRETAKRHGSGTSTPTTVTGMPSKGRPKSTAVGADTSRVDAEGTPDVLRILIDRLKRNGTLDEPIREPLSMDWRAEQRLLPRLKQDIQNVQVQHFLPRKGEIVLYVREAPNITIKLEGETGLFRLHDMVAECWLDYPTWEAGLVTQTPVETVGIKDLLHEPKKEMNVSYSGFRIESLPNINNKDKSLSKRYKYVPLHQIRPFILWKDFLSDIPEDIWHSTIMNALTAIVTFSLLDKYRFKGHWPEAWVYCTGIYVGSELLCVGDAVRLLPRSGTKACTEVLVIKTIRMHLSNLDQASDNDYDEGRPYNSNVFLFGRGYTTEQTPSSKEWSSIEDEQLGDMQQYGALHPLHPPDKEMKIPLNRVLGRLYNAEAISLWLPSPSGKSDLSQGCEGLLEARAWGIANDNRIVNAFGTSWFWGDTRAEALDLQTINGLELSKFDHERDPKEWRKHIKVLENVESEQTRAGQRTAAGGHRSLRGFMAPQQQGSQHSLPVRSGGTRPSVDRSALGSGSGTRTSGTTTSSTSSKRRARTLNLSSGEDDDDEDEEEFRRETKIVEDNMYDSRKRAKVSIVID